MSRLARHARSVTAVAAIIATTLRRGIGLLSAIACLSFAPALWAQATISAPALSLSNAFGDVSKMVSMPALSLTNAVGDSNKTVSMPALSLSNAFGDNTKAISMPALSLSNAVGDSTKTVSMPALSLSNAFGDNTKAISMPALSLSNAVGDSTKTVSMPALSLTNTFGDNTKTIATPALSLTNAFGDAARIISMPALSLTNAFASSIKDLLLPPLQLTAVGSNLPLTTAATTTPNIPNIPTTPGNFSATLVRVTGTAANNSVNPFEPSGLEVAVNVALGRSVTGANLTPSQIVALAPIGGFGVGGSSGNNSRRTLTITSGTLQSVQLGKTFKPLIVQVKLGNGSAAVRVPVTFTLPVTGATASLGPRRVILPVLTDSNGVATLPDLIAVGQAGAFRVLVSTPASTAPVYFELSNTPDGAPTLRLLAGSPQSAIINSDFVTALKVRVTDTANNPVMNAAVKFTAPSTPATATFAGMSSATFVTDASGVATTSLLHAGSVVGAYPVAATLVGGAAAVNFSFTNTAGAPASIELDSSTVSGTPQSTIVAARFANALRVVVRDVAGNPVPNTVVSFTAPASGASMQFNGSHTARLNTGADGIASLSGAAANNIVGSYNVVATVAGITAGVAFALTNRADVPATITATSGTPQSARIGELFQTPMTATVRDRFGNLLAGVAVSFRVTPLTGQLAQGNFSGANIVIVNTDSMGVANAPAFRANTALGMHEVLATVTSIGIPAHFLFTNIVGVPALIVADGGDNQTAIINTSFIAGLAVKVFDAQRNLVPGVVVTFTAPPMSASAIFGTSSGINTNVASVTTDANGRAISPIPVANGSPNLYYVEASFAGGAAPARFLLTNLPQPMPTITLQSGNGQSAAVGTSYSIPLSVAVRQSNGSPASNIAVSFTAPASGPGVAFGGLGGAPNVTVLTDGSGVATAPTAFANALGGSFVVTATAVNIGSVNFNLTNTSLPIPASVAIYSGSGQTTNINTVFGQPMRAIVRNAANAPVAGVTVSFIAPGSGASGLFGLVLGGNGVTDAAGIATAPSFAANGITGTYTVVASVMGLSTPANFMMTNGVVAGPPASVSVFAGSGQFAKVGTAYATTMKAVVRDGSNNPASGVTVIFTAPSSGASGIFSATGMFGTTNTFATTDAAGVATIPASFYANATTGSFDVVATVAGIATPALFNLTNQPAASTFALSIIDGNNQTQTEFGSFACLKVLVTNTALMLPAPAIDVTFSAPTALGIFNGAGAQAMTVQTDGAGVALVCDLTANRNVGAYAVTASSPGATQVSFNETVTAGVQDLSLNFLAGGSLFSGGGASVRLINNWNNPVSGLTVNFRSSAGMSDCQFTGNTLSATAVTNAAGQAGVSFRCSETGPHFFSVSVLGGRFFETTTATIGP